MVVSWTNDFVGVLPAEGALEWLKIDLRFLAFVSIFRTATVVAVEDVEVGAQTLRRRQRLILHMRLYFIRQDAQFPGPPNRQRVPRGAAEPAFTTAGEVAIVGKH